MNPRRWTATTVPIFVLTLALIIFILLGSAVAVQNRLYVEDIARIDRERAVDAARARRDLVRFLQETCSHDAERGRIVIRVLMESRVRALARGDRNAADQYQRAIDDLEFVAQRCFDEVPSIQPEVP